MYSSKHIRLKYLSLFAVIIGAFTQLSIVSTVSEPRTNGKQFVILHWNTWYWNPFPSGPIEPCSFTNCRTTNDRKEFNGSDAVIIHWYDIDVNDIPKRYKSEQKWVIYNWEPPDNIHKRKLRKLITPLVDDIDWTMTYRKDSDIVTNYGLIDNCNGTWNNEDVLDTKPKSISWLVSNCDTIGKREDYVNELRAYIDVDIYGRCGQYCPRNETCNQMVYNPYKFYLSFKSCLCKDYVTEKLYRTLGYDIIPIVLGPLNYTSFAPKHSYINARNFSSPKELSEYLKEVSIDKNKYNSYLLWKRSQCVKPFNDNDFNRWTKHDFCGLCTKLNQMNSNSNSTKKRDIIKWWYDQAHCTNYTNVPRTTVTPISTFIPSTTDGPSTRDSPSTTDSPSPTDSQTTTDIDPLGVNTTNKIQINLNIALLLLLILHFF